jgi:cell division protein FtsW
MIGYLAIVVSNGFDGSTRRFLGWVIFPILLVCVLIIKAHTSNAMIIGGASMLMVLMGASHRKHQRISLLILFIAMSGYVLHIKDIGRGETVSNRVTNWIESTFTTEEKPKGTTGEQSKPKNTGYRQSEIAKFAIISGGLVRIKPGKSVYRKTLSEAHNDYIFAMIVEEYGLLGGILVIIVYLVLFYRILQVIKKCSRQFTSMLVSGLLIVIISQTFIHIGVSVGGLPITGQNLPMISTGGTSIIITSAAFGMILAVSRIAEEDDNKRKLSQTINTEKTV